MVDSKSKKSTDTKKSVKNSGKTVKKSTVVTPSAKDRQKAGLKPPWKKGQSGNKKGRPKKGISAVNDELARIGCGPATKADIEANYMSMIQLTEQQIKEIALDPKKPILVRIIAKNMMSKKDFDVIEKMLDRAIGKATMFVDNTHKGEMTLADGLIAISTSSAAHLKK